MGNKDLTQARQLIKECLETKQTSLNLSNCGIQNLDDLPELFECSHLEELELSNKNINPLLKLLKSKPIIEVNRISEITNRISALKKLKKIECSNIGLLKVNFMLPSLKFLDLSVNKITDTDFLNNLPNLQSLDLNENRVLSINLKESHACLESIDLGRNNILNINFVNDLPNLQSLDLHENRLMNFKLKRKHISLKTLNLGGNSIKNIYFLNNLPNLEILNLNDNRISNLVLDEKHTFIKSFDLSGNYISDLLFLDNFPSLQSLNLSKNSIEKISLKVNNSNLESLDLSNNHISDIGFLEYLIYLKSLNLKKNNILDVSKVVFLKNLRFIDFSNNRIKTIDEKSISHLIQLVNRDDFLETIKLSKIESVKSQNFERAASYRDIEKKILTEQKINNEDRDYVFINILKDLRLESPPMEVIKQGRQAVLDWFEAIKLKLNEIKIILLGDPKAGKTSLLKRLKYNDFDLDEKQTDGVNIEDIEFGECIPFENQKSLHEITGHFWDFGGQEIMNATHQFFLTKRSVYVLVLDARKDANNADQIRQWVKRVQATGGNSPIVVLANQIDVNSGFGFENEIDLQKEFPQIKCFLKISCLTGESLDLLKQKLEEIIPTAELFETKIDEKWIAIKDKLQEETKSKHFLNETRFLEICNEFELKECSKQKNAITFLNDLGMVLHFDNLNLSEYYVLDPYWITYGVYQILTSVYAGEKKGIVEMDKLKFIINDEEDKKEIYQTENYRKIQYSSNERRFLIDILHYFKLCFCLPDNSKFIIPDLLDTLEPQNVTEPIRRSKETIQFVYEYSYLPKSIMPHTIVELHKSMTHMWRTGCVLQNKYGKALITSYQNRIFITVEGEYKKKRELLAVIRYRMDTINHSLSDKPKALIPLPDTNDFAEYKKLLVREERGKKNYMYDEDGPNEKEFVISELLDGIPSNEEVQLAAEIKDLKKMVYNGFEECRDDHQKIIDTMDSQFEQLLVLSHITKEDIQESVQEINADQTAEITSKVLQYIDEGLEHYNGEFKSTLEDIHIDLKKNSNMQAKLRLSIPFIQLLGVDLVTEFDVKKWAKEMYEKHELKIFKLLGMV